MEVTELITSSSKPQTSPSAMTKTTGTSATTVSRPETPRYTIACRLQCALAARLVAPHVRANSCCGQMRRSADET
eukprot:6034247-Prymnesium_polylepis.1